MEQGYHEAGLGDKSATLQSSVLAVLCSASYTVSVLSDIPVCGAPMAAATTMLLFKNLSKHERKFDSLPTKRKSIESTLIPEK